ncbi:MAG: NAD kinase [Paracoccaceae bacterium]
MKFNRIRFLASSADTAQSALAGLVARYGQAEADAADVIVALGGDGFMLHTLNRYQALGLPVYGMNQGTVGFMMNEFDTEGLHARLARAEHAVIHPLRMQATLRDGSQQHALAINEVSLLRTGAQAARLRISVDGRVRMEELVCDGAMVSTPAGSTAYNYSAHGPILPIGAEILALTPVAAFRPRRWRGALLPMTASIAFEVLEPDKRPVNAIADSSEARDVLRVDISSARDISHTLLFDPGHGLEERLLSEQFQ